MAPKKTLFLPISLLSLSTLLIFSLYHFSPPLSSPSLSSPHPPFPNPNPNFSLTLKVLSYDRLPSLARCLRSLAAADYGADHVNLHIFIDHFKPPDEKNPIDLGKKLNGSVQILDFVDGFVWEFGEKVVHYRTGNVGLQAQWLEAWWPSTDHEFAFVVEDDLEVSPLYYGFLRRVIVHYYYNASNFSPWIYGASLQRPRFVPGKHGSKIQLDKETHLFLYQLVGTWGQLLFPRPWKEFRLWYDEHKAKGIKPNLQGMVTTGWYKKMGERIWTPWFIQFIHARGYFNIYTHFEHERALSVSHRDAGVNYGKTAGPDSYLLDKKSLDFDLLEMPPLNNLKWYDFCFKEVIPNRVVKTLDQLGYVLRSLQKLDTVILVSLYTTPESVTRNLICHFERVNIRNYIFMGPHSDFLVDLARRGIPVIDAIQFLDNIGPHKFKIEEILVKAHVIKKSLELGFDTWVIEGDMIPLLNDSFLDLVGPTPTADFYIGKLFKFLFVRRSYSARKIMVDDIMMMGSEINRDSDSTNGNKVLVKLLEQKGEKMEWVDEISFGVKIDSSNVTEKSLVDGKKIAFWSFETGYDLIQIRLEDLGFWIIDGEFSCTAVICHQS